MMKVYFDTNIVLYILDRRPESASKKVVRTHLVASHVRVRSAVISTQVLQETYDNGVRKLKLSPGIVSQYVQDFAGMEVVATDTALVIDSITISQRYQFRIFDALMIAAAKRAGCTTLYTEDLSHLQVIDGVRIVNPFREEPAP